jgi:hypothetical protein
MVVISNLPTSVSGQAITVNMGAIDGIALSPQNILNYQVYSTMAGNVKVKGTIRYRTSNLSASYTFTTAVREGLNVFSPDHVHPQWQFSSSVLQELFFTHQVLPEGTYEYCVSISPTTVAVEAAASGSEECLYHKSGDLFLINLVSPDNDAKLHEYYPLLTWVANYSFASQLTYRLRVAEIKQGQNPVNAIMRNQPLFDEKSLMQNSLVYPVYAKPLEANKPYAWTVDAYYKGLLVGGAESWRFTIIEDSVLSKAPTERSHIDIKKESGLNQLSALGMLRLKYVLDDAKKDVLTLELFNEDNKKRSLSPETFNASYGDNRYVLDLTKTGLKDGAMYTLKIVTQTRHEYKLLFRYLNPDFQN